MAARMMEIEEVPAPEGAARRSKVPKRALIVAGAGLFAVACVAGAARWQQQGSGPSPADGKSMVAGTCDRPQFSGVEGPCSIDADGCALSPNYPSNYDNGQQCTFTVADPSRATPLQVVSFSTEPNFDTLEVNGERYSGSWGPDGVVPKGNVYWTSDSSSTAGGFRLCYSCRNDPCETCRSAVDTLPIAESVAMCYEACHKLPVLARSGHCDKVCDMAWKVCDGHTPCGYTVCKKAKICPTGSDICGTCKSAVDSLPISGHPVVCLATCMQMRGLEEHCEEICSVAGKACDGNIACGETVCKKANLCPH